MTERNNSNMCIHSLLTFIKERQTVTAHNTERHCRVRFYAQQCGTTFVKTAV